MPWYRWVGVCLAVLLWLTTITGCVDYAQNDANVDDLENTSELGDEIVLAKTDAPQVTEPELPIVIPHEQIAGLGRGGLLSLEPELQVYRDTPEKIKKYSTPEGMEEIREKAAQSLAIPIMQAVRKLPYGKQTKPRAGFAVRGRDRAALPEVHRVLVQGEEPGNSFPLGSEVSIIFFSHPTTPRLRPIRVVRAGNSIEIHYTMIFRGHGSSSSTIVFIPCGELIPGEYKVEMIRSSRKEKEMSTPDWPPVESGIENWIVCQPFTFTILDGPNQEESLKTLSVSPQTIERASR